MRKVYSYSIVYHYKGDVSFSYKESRELYSSREKAKRAMQAEMTAMTGNGSRADWVFVNDSSVCERIVL